jgi:magnesium transporter
MPRTERESTAYDLAGQWWELPLRERVRRFRRLKPDQAQQLFFDLGPREQAELVLALPPAERLLWMRALEPDEAADLVQEAPEAERPALVALLDETTRREVAALLTYRDDVAGGLMNPRFAALRPEMTAGEALGYVRRFAREQAETGRPYYAYVLDPDRRLLGVVSLHQLLGADPDEPVRDLMRTQVVTVPADADQETVAALFRRHRLLALPVVDGDRRVVGVVTVDDIVDVLQEEATEDIHRLGGVEALDVPYTRVPFRRLLRKRAGWLALLFVGESLTATAMAFFEHEIARAVVLALFLPLIISSGGNSGSQAATLVVRAMALGELAVRDVWRVLRRELLMGLGLGAVLAAIGLLRILLWQAVAGTYGEHYLPLAFAVALSLVGVVTWGTLAGATLPFLLRTLRFDPASASAPLVATLVDVTGIVIYFTVASLVLRGTLL